MRIRPLLAGAAGLAAIVATAAPAAAIKYGQPDDGEHPYVGFMLAYVTGDHDEDPETEDELSAVWRCSGTLLDEDTFLTAGHCTSGADAVAIWFDEDLDSIRLARDFYVLDDVLAPAYSNPPDAVSYEVHNHPDYDDDAFYLHDVGIVDALQWIDGNTVASYGELPELGYWDTQIAAKKKDRDSYESVGYGLQWATPTRGNSPRNDNRRSDEGRWERLKAKGELIGYRNFGGGKDNDAYVVLTNNANTGGTCSGDSGGPTFIAGETTVVAVTSFGMNETCAGTSGVYRIDTADDLEFINGFLLS